MKNSVDCVVGIGVVVVVVVLVVVLRLVTLDTGGTLVAFVLSGFNVFKLTVITLFGGCFGCRVVFRVLETLLKGMLPLFSDGLMVVVAWVDVVDFVVAVVVVLYAGAGVNAAGSFGAVNRFFVFVKVDR